MRSKTERIHSKLFLKRQHITDFLNTLGNSVMTYSLVINNFGENQKSVMIMRLLMFHTESFWYRQNESPADKPTEIGESIHVWIHSEEQDEENETSVLRKMVKNIRWLAQKNECTAVTLHSFAHLDNSKSDPKFAEDLIEEVASRLIDREFDVHIVPYGEFYEFNMHVKGPSLAKVFKQF